MQYDGSINFDTRIDRRGFNQGIRDMPNAVESLKRTFENLAKTIGIAFSVGAVLQQSVSVSKPDADRSRGTSWSQGF